MTASILGFSSHSEGVVHHVAIAFPTRTGWIMPVDIVRLDVPPKHDRGLATGNRQKRERSTPDDQIGGVKICDAVIGVPCVYVTPGSSVGRCFPNDGCSGL